MQGKIEVLVDIYRGYFTNSAYCYSNVRAVNKFEQSTVSTVDAVIQNMLDEGNSQLLETDLIIRQEYSPIEENRKCFLDLDTKQFEF